MKLRRLLVILLNVALCIAFFMPEVLADTGSNDFTATLSVSDTSVPANTTVTCSITVKNTDPTYGADVVVSTSGGTLVSSFYLGAGQTRVVTHNVYITDTKSIYYTVYASHGPDISKTKNTNTVTVTVEEESSGQGQTDLTPAENIIAEMPEIEYEPIHGVPKSGSVFIASIENVVYDGIAIPDGGDYIISTLGEPATLSGEIHYHLPDSIAADYFDRTEEESVYLTLHLHMSGDSAGAMEEVYQFHVITEDDGIIEFEETLVFNDLPLLHDDIIDYISINTELYDPLEDLRSLDYSWIGVINGPETTDGYTISMGNTYLDGDLVNTDEVIEITYGENFLIEQNIEYTVPEEELTLPDWNKIDIYANCNINGVYPHYVTAPWIAVEPESTEGEAVFSIAGDSTSFNPWRLDYGYHTIEIFAYQERDTIPGLSNRAVMTLTICVVDDEHPAEEAPVEEPEYAIHLFDGVFHMNLWEWLGLDTDSVDLVPDLSAISITGEGDVELSGIAEYNCNESFMIRIYGSEGFGDPFELVSLTSWGECMYSRTVHLTESTEFDITAELVTPEGDVIVSDTETVVVTVIPVLGMVDFTQRYSLTAAPAVVGMGEDTVIYYSLSNEFTGRAVHIRLIDEEDGSIVFEDENFEHFEIYDGSLVKTPGLPTHYRFTAQVIADDGSVLWEQTKETFVIVMPNPAEDDGEETVFNLNLGASRTAIAPGEDVRIYGAIDYGSFDALSVVGEIDVTVTDQDGHVIYMSAGVMPHDIMAFDEVYTLTETTTFAITARGDEAAGDHEYEDTDTITIVVEGDSVVPEEEPEYDITFSAEASETVIAPGEAVEITAVIANLSTENVSTVVYDEAGSFFGGIVGWLHFGESMTASETMIFDETTTISLRAVAWADGDMVVFTETIYLTIEVDPALAEAPEAEEDAVYSLDIGVAAGDLTIERGESTDVFIDIINTGSEAVDISVYDGGGAELFFGEDIMPGALFDNVLHWAPEFTSVLTVRAYAMNETGTVVYTDARTVTVSVTEPPEESETSIDIDVTTSETEIEAGDLVDISIDITNTGTETIDNYVISESLTGSHHLGADFASGEERHIDITGWVFDRPTTVIFVVRAYNADGAMIAEDTASISIDIIYIEEEDEVPPAHEEPGSDEPDEEMLDDGTAVDEAAEEIIDDLLYEGGVELSLRPAARDADIGEIVIISSDDNAREAEEDIYRIRRILVLAILLLCLVIIILIIILISKAVKKNRKPHADEGFDDFT